MSFAYPLSVPSFGKEEMDAAVHVLHSGNTTMGAQVARFEKDFAKKVGAKYAVMVNSGSSADLLLAFGLVGIGLLAPGDEVLCPAVTWPTQVWAWKMAGLDVRLVDVNPFTLNSDCGNFLSGATERTKALSLVHLMGVPCEMGPLWKLAKDNDWLLTEDCCEALGARYAGKSVGTFGAGAAWSFFFSHQMSTMEGGMVTTDNGDLADHIRGLRSHGWTRHLGPDLYTFATWGFNVRPTEVNAAIGRAQLRKLDGMNDKRMRNFQTFAKAVRDIPIRLPRPPALAQPSWFGIPIVVEPDAGYTRDEICARLHDKGIETRPILGGNLGRQPVAKEGLFTCDLCPGADEIDDHGLFIGLHPEECDMEMIAGVFR